MELLLIQPSNEPGGVISFLNTHINDIVESPEISESITKLGLFPSGKGNPTELRKFCEVEIARGGEVLRQAGMAGTQ